MVDGTLCGERVLICLGKSQVELYAIEMIQRGPRCSLYRGITIAMSEHLGDGWMPKALVWDRLFALGIVYLGCR